MASISNFKTDINNDEEFTSGRTTFAQSPKPEGNQENRNVPLRLDSPKIDAFVVPPAQETPDDARDEQQRDPETTSSTNTSIHPPSDVGVAGTSTGGVQKVKELACGAYETAKGYVGVAGETVEAYLPPSVAGYISKPASNTTHKPSEPNVFESASSDSLAKLPEERRVANLPSHDDESYTPFGHSGGVGRLPGTSEESSVAVLPDEKALADGTTGGEGVKDTEGTYGPALSSALNPRKDDAFGTQPTGAGSFVPVPIFSSESVPHPSGTSDEDNEVPEGKPSPIPENDDAVDVTRSILYPSVGVSAANRDMVTQPPAADVQAPTRPHVQSSDSPSRVLDGSHPQDQLDSQQSDTQADAHDSQSKAPTHPLQPVDTSNSQPHQPIPRTEGHPRHEQPRHVPDIHFHTTELHADKLHSARYSSKKPGFADKVKGEVKVIQGKITKDEKKVEEGRRIMGKN